MNPNGYIYGSLRNAGKCEPPIKVKDLRIEANDLVEESIKCFINTGKHYDDDNYHNEVWWTDDKDIVGFFIQIYDSCDGDTWLCGTAMIKDGEVYLLSKGSERN